jgi:hypothetical protein
MTAPEREAEIIRLYFAEHWRVGTIAAQLGVHPDVVRRVLGLGAARPEAAPRPRLVDPYRGFITETLARYPKLRATRLHDMVAQRGYAGAVRTLREYVATVRPRPRREVYLRTEPLPGEQAQIDWAYVGKIEQWGTVFPGAACVVALVDRFNQHCHKVDIDADSWRDRHSFEREDSPEKPSTPPNRPTRKR